MQSVNLLLKKVKRRILKSKFRKSFAQSGEDLILDTIFSNIKIGSYIDVGACDPFFQSNTQFFYQKGWRGINIDANKDSIKKLIKIRPHDRNILGLVHNKEEEIVFYFYENPAYNGCLFQENIPSRLLYSKKIKGITLTKILLTENFTKINFLSIDVEGNDLNVLKSLDLNKIRPQVIVVESFAFDIKRDLETEITKYLNYYNYEYFCKTVSNSFYIAKEFLIDRFGTK